MKKFLLPESGKFYKANLHCHTDISDGKLSPLEVKEVYKSMGYSAVCYTDHEVLIGHTDLCDDDFVALHGYEVAIKKDINDHTGLFMPVYHFNMIAEKQDNLYMPRCFATNPSMPGDARRWFNEHAEYDENDTIDTTEYSIEWLNQYLPAVRDKGFLITYNHPQWSLQNCTDYIGLKGLFAIEAMNGSCFALGDASMSIHFEQMLRSGMNVVPVGGDDNHSRSACGRSFTMIKADSLSYDSLIDAYKKGNCYCSSGPEIHELYIEDGKIIVKTSDAALITLIGEGRLAHYHRNCNEAEFDYRPDNFGRYFRIEVKDEKGDLAFSRAYFISDIEA